VLSIHLIATSFAFLNLANTARKKIIHNYCDVTVKLQNGNGNGRELGIDRWEKWEWDLSFRWKWEWDGNGNEAIEMGGNWDKKSVPAHL